MKKLLTIISILLLTSCSSEKLYERESVEAVYWHEGKRYSAAFRTGDEITIKRIPVGAGHGWPYHSSMNVITDAVAGSWYECGWKHSVWTGNKDAWCNIHIASLDELTTGDWNHGKFGRGTTSRID